MPHALLNLILLQGKGVVRRGARGAGTPRRMVLLVLGVAVLVLWIGPGLISAVKLPRSDPNRVRAATPVALLGICVLTVVTSVGDKAISFTPGEMDLLFPAPFTRRQLLAYKLTKSTLGAGLTALVLSAALLRHAQWWPACYVGIFLTLLFVQFFSIAAVLIAQTVGARAYSRARVAVLLGAAVLAVAAGRYWAQTTDTGGNPSVTLERLAGSPVGRVVLAPLAVFGEAITAPTAARLADRGGLAAFIDAALLGCVVLLDAQYLEAATAATRRRAAHVRRIRGGAMLSLGVSRTPRWHLPMPPWADGAGPLAWRQATLAARSSGGLLLLLVIVAVGAGPVFASGARARQFGAALVGVIAWLTFLVSGMLKFDFRGDVDHMETLKALPIRPRAIVAGQLVVPVVMLTAIHVPLILLAARAMPAARGPLLCAAALALPFNAVLFAVENMAFLLYPSRPAAVSPGDFQVLGRQAVVLALKLVALLLSGVVPFAAGVLAYVLAGGSWAAGAAVAWLLLGGEAVAMVPLLCWAYGRFDPSLDTPA